MTSHWLVVRIYYYYYLRILFITRTNLSIAVKWKWMRGTFPISGTNTSRYFVFYRGESSKRPRRLWQMGRPIVITINFNYIQIYACESNNNNDLCGIVYRNMQYANKFSVSFAYHNRWAHETSDWVLDLED